MAANGNAPPLERGSNASGPWIALAAGVTAFLAVCAFFFSFEMPWTMRGDNMVALFPMNLDAYQSWLRGFAPEWSGGLWGGFPLLSDPTSGSLYWPNFLFFALTPEPHLRAFDLSTAFHAALLTAGSVRLLQALGASPAAAVFGGLLTLLAPTQQWFASAILHSYAPLAWWPWLWLAAERLSQPDRRVLSGAMLLGWIALASQGLWYPEFALYSGVLAGLWLLTRRAGLPFAQRIGRAALLGVGGLVIAAPQLLPTTLYLFSTARGGSLPFEAAALVSFRGSLASLVAGDPTGAGMPHYLGGAALLLATIPLATQRPRAVFLWIVAAVGLCLALGARTPLYGLLHALPPFDKFRSPMKFFMLSELAIVWLAALGAGELLRRKRSRWLIAAAGVLMTLAVAERVSFDARRLLDEDRLPGGQETSFATYRQRLLQSGLIEAARAHEHRPPPRILETAGLRHMIMLHDLEQLTGGPTPLRDERHRELIKSPSLYSVGVRMRRADLDRWGVHFLLTRAHACEERAESSGLELLLQTSATCLFENPTRPPRYSFIEMTHSMPTWDSMISFLRIDPAGPIPLFRRGAEPERNLRFAPGTVEVQRYRPGAVQLRVNAEGPAMLFVRESLSTGWRGEVDGRGVPLHPAAGIFFALPVPAGEHEVRLLHTTPGLRPGLMLSAAWIVVALSVGIAQRRGGRV